MCLHLSDIITDNPVTQAMTTLFPHHLGHYIGLDVHDCPGYSRSHDLKAGQCITIEPYANTLTPGNLERATNVFPRGIYVPDDSRWPEKFRGIGIRIEDSVCVGDDHPIVLTPEAVKEVRFMNSHAKIGSCRVRCSHGILTLSFRSTI